MEHVLAIARQSHCLVPSFVLDEAYHALLVLISCQLVWAEFSFLELLQKGRSCGLPVTVVCLPVDPDESGQKEQREDSKEKYKKKTKIVLWKKKTLTKRTRGLRPGARQTLTGPCRASGNVAPVKKKITQVKDNSRRMRKMQRRKHKDQSWYIDRLRASLPNL